MKIQYFLYIVAAVFVISIAGNIIQYFQPPKIISRTVKETVDTAKIKQQLTAQITAQLKAELKPEVKLKTVVAKTNIDSIYEAAKEYWMQQLHSDNPDTLNYYNYIAEADTTYKDSVGVFNVKYISQIPLPPSGFFELNAEWYNRDITHTINTTEIIQKKSFWDNFNYSVFAGPGIDLINKNIGLYVGIGITFTIKPVL